VTLRIGTLGAGTIATIGYGYLPGLTRLVDRVAVTAIASRTRARAEAVAADWDIPAVSDTLDAMLADDDVDAVINPTPTDAHYETSLQIIESRDSCDHAAGAAEGMNGQ
jgi:predicted dehydrogenase